MENSFVANVELLGKYQLETILKDVDQQVEIKDKNIDFKDLELQVINLSSRSYVDIAVKDFASTYEQSIKIYQNIFGDYEKFVNIMRSYGPSRNYVIYNKVILKPEGFIMKRMVIPVPLYSKFENSIALQRALDSIKSITFLPLFSQTYSRHCINKRYEDASMERDETFDICVIILQNGSTNVSFSNYQDQDVFKSFVQVVQDTFEEKLNETEINLKKSAINVNYAVAYTNVHYEISNLLSKFEASHSISFKSDSTIFMIINNTNEKFVFKQFSSSNNSP
jgi:hypothetical protein